MHPTPTSPVTGERPRTNRYCFSGFRISGCPRHLCRVGTQTRRKAVQTACAHSRPQSPAGPQTRAKSRCPSAVCRLLRRLLDIGKAPSAVERCTCTGCVDLLRVALRRWAKCDRVGDAVTVAVVGHRTGVTGLGAMTAGDERQVSGQGNLTAFRQREAPGAQRRGLVCLGIDSPSTGLLVLLAVRCVSRPREPHDGVVRGCPVGAPWENVGQPGVNERSWGTLQTARSRGLKCGDPCSAGVSTVERVTGIEPAWPAWKAGALPLSYTRVAPGDAGDHGGTAAGTVGRGCPRGPLDFRRRRGA